MTLTVVRNSSTKSSTEGNIEVIPVVSSLVEWWWPFAGPYVDKAIPYNFGEATSDDIMEACKERDMQLWVIQKNRKTVGAATTMVVSYARKKVARCVTVGGDGFDEWGQEAIDTLVKWAQEAGCDGAEVCARRGFEKKLKDLGFNTQYVVMAYGKSD